MKAIAICCLWLMGYSLALAGKRPDPNKSGSHSHLLNHSLVFEAGSKDKEPCFVATLTNISTTKLKIMVNAKEFHSVLRIKDRSGKEDDVSEKKYRIMRLTGTWSEPQIEMAPKESITWVVPLSSLLTMHEKPVTHESLQGCTVISEMNMAAVPANGNYVENNAHQKSKPILIPDKD